ncbi:hypothetical protein [Allokutzneria oryzae]|uniref:Uncharacterized protein n=1 Tax=Allokutzneria oryzae TaxID=1378989 RepID=A0ABV5ZQG9_9PSEU
MGENDALQDRLQALGEAVELTLTGLERLPSEPLPFAAAALVAVEFDAVAARIEPQLSVFARTDTHGTAEPLLAALRAARGSLAAEGFDPQTSHDRFVELLGSLQEHRQSARSRELRPPSSSLWYSAIPDQLTRPATGGSRHRAPDSHAV